MKAQLKDALPGERWEFDDGRIKGVVVDIFAVKHMAFVICGENDARIKACCCLLPGWTKTHNADGTPYEEPKPLPEFIEVWGARDRDGSVCLYEDNPPKGESFWGSGGSESFNFGKIQFRPELPWDETACRVRVRLEVVE